MPYYNIVLLVDGEVEMSGYFQAANDTEAEAKFQAAREKAAEVGDVLEVERVSDEEGKEGIADNGGEFQADYLLNEYS